MARWPVVRCAIWRTTRYPPRRPLPRAAPAAAAPPPAAKANLGPGALTGFGSKECQPNDSTPDGTVVGGFKKMSITTPFGKSCLWDPVK